MLTPSERQQILVQWNQTTRGYPLSQCLHELVEAQVERSPDAVAVVFENRQLTYRQLNHRANQLAERLQKLGIGPNVFVGICVERSLEMVVGLLGILKAGGTYVPLDPEYPVDRLAFMIADAAAPVLLTQQHLVSRLPTHNAQVLCLDTDVYDGVDVKPACAAGPEDLAYMIYTSGSTGKPKGAMNHHRGIVNRLLWMQDEYKLTAADTVLQKTPFSFDVSVWEFFWPLLAGARLVLAKPGGHREPEYLVDLITKQNVTVLHFVPSMLQLFLEEPQAGTCQSVRTVICSGEALPYELQEQFFERLPAQLHNLYGPTEAAVDVTHWACQRDSALRTVPIGRPVANTQCYILDDKLQPVPVGEAGELHLGGVQVGRGYHNRPELTAEKFILDPFRPGNKLYRTGDLARYRPDGAIEYLGRLDHQVKIRGFRIELGEIEAQLAEHPAVKQVVVVAREDEPGAKYLVAYLVAGEVRVEELRELLLRSLPDYMVPATFVWLKELPLSPNGKIDRRALPKPETPVDPTAADEAPRTEVERTIAGIWQEVLRVKRVGLHDNFFELGGDSLNLARVHRKLHATLQGDLAIVTLFQYPTISALAKFLNQRENISPAKERVQDRAQRQRQAMARQKELQAARKTR
jgi:amino acid adenylation domain-containing protein